MTAEERDEARKRSRGSVMSFEQLASPVRPFVPAAAAKVETVEVYAGAERLPVEVVDPCHRNSSRPSVVPARSRLSPSQRASQQRRASGANESEGRSAYVTYTVDPRT